MTKIDIISGFLGAGKTTLIKKLLSEGFKGEQVVLIENEFGEIGIDGGFLKEAGIEIREMNSGCICCSLVGDFGKSLHEVVDTYHPDRILIEPSGVGKLSDVIKAVQDVQDEIDAELNSFTTSQIMLSTNMYQFFAVCIRQFHCNRSLCYRFDFFFLLFTVTHYPILLHWRTEIRYIYTSYNFLLHRWQKSY